LFSCKEDENPPSDDDDETTETEAEVQLDLLTAHIWVPGTITKDAATLTAEYPYFENFTLSFSGTVNSERTNVNNGTYTTNDKGEVLPSGSWEFGSDAETELLLTDPFNGPTEVTYSVTENRLRLEFVRDDTNGRTEAISGQYVFDLVPQ
ncbi:MAG: hypothetical protein AAF223_06255, partial [Bacteroidota bacterium]